MGIKLETIVAAIFWLVLAYFLLIPALAVLGCFLLYEVVAWVRESPSLLRSGSRRQSRALYKEALALSRSKAIPTTQAFQKMVWDRLLALTGNDVPVLQISMMVPTVAAAIYEAEGLGVIPPPPPRATRLDEARYGDTISALVTKLSTPGLADIAADTVALSLAGFCRALPPMARQSNEALHASIEAGLKEAEFSVRLLDAIPKVGDAVQAMALPFYSDRVMKAGLFAGIRDQLDRNQHAMSDVPYIPDNFASPKLVNPGEHKGTDDEIARGYLRHTPFLDRLDRDIPFELPDSARFEHHWIVAGSGHGKTQTLQYLIANDLERVAKGGASVVVIDSQGDLIKAISELRMFAPGQPLDGKLCLIDPTDIEYPVALNLFDVGMDRFGGYKPLDRERLMNGILELYDFVLSSLLSAELTQKQSVIFRYITRLMLHIPGATIHTFRELMEPKGYEKYKSHIDKLDGTARAFFETEFNSKQFEETKRQVVRRLWGILENRTFERMFSHPKNKLDLFAEMNAGKVIVINTAKELLKQTGTEIFGRFFIALIAQAAQERATIDKDRRMPTFVYIDECQDYLDQNISLILEQARKFNVGMVLAHQYVGQLAPKLQESFAANTSIKFAGGVSDKDAKALSHMLRCTPEFIFEQGKGHFAASVRGLTNSAFSLAVPFGHLEALPRMSEAEFDAVRASMRARYAVPWEEIGREATVELAPAKAEPAPLTTEPAREW